MRERTVVKFDVRKWGQVFLGPGARGRREGNNDRRQHADLQRTNLFQSRRESPWHIRNQFPELIGRLAHSNRQLGSEYNLMRQRRICRGQYSRHESMANQRPCRFNVLSPNTIRHAECPEVNQIGPKTRQKRLTSSCYTTNLRSRFTGVGQL